LKRDDFLRKSKRISAVFTAGIIQGIHTNDFSGKECRRRERDTKEKSQERGSKSMTREKERRDREKKEKARRKREKRGREKKRVLV